MPPPTSDIEFSSSSTSLMASASQKRAHTKWHFLHLSYLASHPRSPMSILFIGLLLLVSAVASPCAAQSGDECVQVNPRVICLSDGGYEYHVTLINTSSFTFEYLFLLPGTGVGMLAPSSFELINLAPGDSQDFIYTVTGGVDGEEICFEQVLHSEDLSECCFFDVCIRLTCDTEIEFLRGDCNNDGAFDIADVIFMLGFLFGPGQTSVCDDACDCNDDGQLNIADAISKLGALFGSGGGLPAPVICGPDPTPDNLDCMMSAC